MVAISRTIKKTVIGGVYLGIIILISVSFLPKSPIGPSCFDHKKNGTEEGIDCGGSCQACVQTFDLQVIDSGFVVNNRTLDAMVRVKNPNSSFGISSLSYNFNFVDPDGVVLFTREGQSFIMPNETKYLVLQAIPFDVLPQSMNATFDSVRWEPLAGIPRLELLLPTPRVITENIPFFAQLTGLVINNSDLYFDEIIIVGVIKDSSDRLVGIRQTQARGLQSKERRDYSMSWSEPLIGELSNIDVEAYSNLFINENYINKSTRKERFQQF